MTRDDEALATLVQALGRAPLVEEKRMFGGITFMVRGKICVCADKGRIMRRIDPALHDAAVKRKGCRTIVIKGREYRGYVKVDAEAVKTMADLRYWIGLVID